MGKEIYIYIIHMRWIVFFSQTGTEIVDICQNLNKIPDFIITNNSEIEHLKIFNLYKKKIKIIPYNPKESDYIKLFEDLDITPKNVIITLHGYLRIIPDYICKKYSIINLHPGLITKYPELKGLNPQKRAVELNHKIIGCVLHKVTKDVDSGEIIIAKEIYSNFEFNKNLSDLKQLSLELWLKYLKKFVVT